MSGSGAQCTPATGSQLPMAARTRRTGTGIAVVGFTWIGRVFVKTGVSGGGGHRLIDFASVMPRTFRQAGQCEHRYTSDPALLRAILKVRDGAGGGYW
jgi:hypothetical protein